jgi:dihydrolipoamide dehydrogenase
VLVVEFLDRIVPWADAAMATQLQRALAKQGLAFRLSTQAKSAERTASGMRVMLSGPGEPPLVDADVVLVAVGRRPYTEGLGARELGVAYDEHGRIVVNERFETSVPGVYAIGDVIPGPMLAHKGEEDAIAAVEGMAGHPVHVDYDLVPNVVYTAPELASVGLTEEQAKARGDVRIGTFPFQANARARCLDETEGGVKIIADATTDRILGIHILGARASDLIAEAVLAMEYGASAEDIARTVHAHPTLPEAVREAALGVAKRSINI